MNWRTIHYIIGMALILAALFAISYLFDLGARDIVGIAGSGLPVMGETIEVEYRLPCATVSAAFRTRGMSAWEAYAAVCGNECIFNGYEYASYECRENLVCMCLKPSP